MSYILVTPAKNEGMNLSKLIQSMLRQTIKPLIWLIVDDGSTDNTPEIIKKAKGRCEWIQSIRLKEHPRDLSIHYAQVCNRGFDFVTRYSKINDISYEYIGLIDADVVLEAEYFSKLIKKFEESPKLGIASGSLSCKVNNKVLIEKIRADLPFGAIRLWRKECFEETGGGYLMSYSPDAVANVLAYLRGWETKCFTKIRAQHARKTSSVGGFWKGYMYHGKSAYFRNYPLLFVLLKGLKLTFEKPHYIGVAYLYGYLSSIIRRTDKINNEEVKNYYRRQKYEEVIKYYKNEAQKVVKKNK